MTHSKGAMEAAQRTFERSCEKILDTVVSDNRMRALAELISTHTHDTELAEALWKSKVMVGTMTGTLMNLIPAPQPEQTREDSAYEKWRTSYGQSHVDPRDAWDAGLKRACEIAPVLAGDRQYPAYRTGFNAAVAEFIAAIRSEMGGK